MTPALTARCALRPSEGRGRGSDSTSAAHLPKNQPEPQSLRQKRHSWCAATGDMHLSSGITAISTIIPLTESWRFGRKVDARTRDFRLEVRMSSLKMKLGDLAAGLMLSGCMQASSYEATIHPNFKPRNKELLARIRYANTP